MQPIARWPPDAFAALAILAAVALEWLVPVQLLPPAGWPTIAIGAAVASAGVALELAAARALGRAGTTTRPGRPPDALVTAGPFARSRNPFYCGLLLVLAGLCVAASLDWGIVAVPALWLALDRIVVPGEERRLAAAFGPAFAAYAARVPRWIGPVRQDGSTSPPPETPRNRESG